MSETPNPTPSRDRFGIGLIAFAVFLAVGAAAGLVAVGVMYAHHSDHGMGGGSMMGQEDGDRSMMGQETGDRSMGDRGGMMGSMSVASEREFLREMIPHHEEAIASAKILRDGTERQEMRDFANAIIKTQQSEVDSMTRWLDRWHEGAKPSTDYSPMMRSDLDELRGDDLDRAFLQDMPMHHMMAVHMSRSLIAQDLARHDEVEALAGTIARTQMEEIWQMHEWIADWFGSEAGQGGMMQGARGSMM